MNKTMKHVAVAGLLSEKNFGDIIIHDCACNLTKQKFQRGSDTGIVRISFQVARHDTGQRSHQTSARFLTANLARFASKGGPLFYSLSTKVWKKHYKCLLNNSTALIVAGGGLIKYQHQQLWMYLCGMIDAADSLDIPVYLNAIGVEGYDKNDVRCMLLRNAVNRDVVKHITTRDDLETLRKNYIIGSRGEICKRIADPAVWAAETYDIKRDSASDIVGLGLVRGGIFRDHGYALSTTQVVRWYVAIIKELDRRGIRWVGFTNGYPGDIELVSEIFARTGHKPNSTQIMIPSDARGLVQIISRFKGIIAARLHANIISYSLDIPSIGLVWNDKLKFFGEAIGYPDRFISPEVLDGECVVDKLETAMNHGYAKGWRDTYRATASDGISKFIRQTLGPLK